MSSHPVVPSCRQVESSNHPVVPLCRHVESPSHQVVSTTHLVVSSGWIVKSLCRIVDRGVLSYRQVVSSSQLVDTSHQVVTTTRLVVSLVHRVESSSHYCVVSLVEEPYRTVRSCRRLSCIDESSNRVGDHSRLMGGSFSTPGNTPRTCYVDLFFCGVKI